MILFSLQIFEAAGGEHQARIDEIFEEEPRVKKRYQSLKTNTKQVFLGWRP